VSERSLYDNNRFLVVKDVRIWIGDEQRDKVKPRSRNKEQNEQ
jgi:hypothetical protein